MLGVSTPPPGARFHGTLPGLGAPIHKAFYADGFVVCTYSVKADPTIGAEASHRYLTWQWDAAREEYAQLALPQQIRPLYRPENIESHPDWPVYILEREEMVDLFHELSGETQVIATTAPGGCPQFAMGDWEELFERDLVFWPTNTEESIAENHKLAKRLQKAGCRIKVVTYPQESEKNFSVLYMQNWSWPQIEAWLATNVREAMAEVIPIRAAKLSNPAPPVEPRQAKQAPAQVVSYRDAWARIKGLTYAPNGTPYSNVYNITCALNAQSLDVWYDEFHHRVMHDTQDPKFWADHDDTELTCTLQGRTGFAGVRTATVHEAVYAIARRTLRHEVRDWLRTLKWDSSSRLALMLPVAYGTPKMPYFTSVGRCFLMAAVARVLYPGCQVDYVPVFEGRGEIGKTSSLRILFGRWFDNPSSMMGDKDFLQNMCGKWCLELGELANITGRALEVVKSCITRSTDTYRAAFGRAPGDYPRQCIFAGTVDRDDWNADEAGGRRWWPIECRGQINLEWLHDNKEQLFAEALERVESAEPWHNVDPRDAATEQAARRPRERWIPLIERYLEGQNETTIENIMRGALEFDKAKDWKPADLRRAVIALKTLGWSERDSGKRWVPPPPKPT